MQRWAPARCQQTHPPFLPVCLFAQWQAREGLKVITIICANRVSLGCGLLPCWLIDGYGCAPAANWPAANCNASISCPDELPLAL